MIDSVNSLVLPSYDWFAVALGWILLWVFWLRRLRSPRFSVAIFRLVVLLLLAVAISKPYFEESESSSSAFVLLDISESMDEATAQNLLNRAKNLFGSDIEVKILPFAAEVGPFPAVADWDFRDNKRSWVKLNLGESNLESALANSGAHGSAVLLISDGRQTRGDVARVFELMRANGVRVSPLLPTVREEVSTNRFGVTFLHAPLTVAAQKSAQIRATISNSTTKQQSGLVEIRHDKKVILKRDVSVGPGEDLVIVAESDPAQDGIKEVITTVTPTDRELPVTRQRIFLSGEQREKILLISGGSDDHRVLSPLLRSNQYQLTEIVADRSVTIPPLGEFSAVIYNNVARDQLPEFLPSKIEQYVRDGGGFLMIGGNRSFGLGKYIGTPIERVLPVEMLPPRTEKKRLNVAVQLVLDKSRSMVLDQRMEFAKEAAREVIKNLKDDDFVGVIGFDNAPFKVVDIGQVGDIRNDALVRVGRLFATGKTNLMPALDIARRGLLRVDAGRKHMIVLTDGELPDGGQHYVELVRQLRTLGITVSTVLLGSDSGGELLKAMAEVGGGGFYQTRSASNLPSIFLQDVRVSTGERTLKEESEFTVRQGPAGVVSTTVQSFPQLLGYVQTKQKNTAKLELVAVGSNKAEPLLASWKFGAGKVIAFTSDANGRWSQSWVRWPRFQTFWTDLLDAVRPQTRESERIPFDLRHTVEHGAMLLDLSIYSETARAIPTAKIVAPDGKELPVLFEAKAPGRYQAKITGVIPGKYELRAAVGGKNLTPVAWDLSGELLGEKRGLGFDATLLEQIASATGGALNPSDGSALLTSTQKKERTLVVTPFIVLALLMLLGEIILRERRRAL